MNTMTYKGYVARIDYDDDDRLLVGRIAGITDVVSFHADDVGSLRAAFEEAVDDYVQTCADIGKDPQKSYSGKLMLRVEPKVHADAAIAAELAGVSLNQWAGDILAKAASMGLPAVVGEFSAGTVHDGARHNVAATSVAASPTRLQRGAKAGQFMTQGGEGGASRPSKRPVTPTQKRE